MNVVYFNKKNINKLKKLYLNTNIISTEAELLVTEGGDLFKRFYVNEGEYFHKKLYTISSLNEHKELFDSSFVLPESLVSIGGKISGYTMPYIPGENFDNFLNNAKISEDIKVKYLKDAAIMMEKASIIREKAGLDNFYLGDIHSQNFVLGSDGLKMIDMDSVRIGYMDGFPIKNSFPVRNFKLYNKYIIKDGVMLPNKASDTAMFNLMIINHLAGMDMQRKELEDYYDYLDYLKNMGLDKNIIKEFSNIYSENEGKVLHEELKHIPADAYKFRYKIHEVRKNEKRK